MYDTVLCLSLNFRPNKKVVRRNGDTDRETMKKTNNRILYPMLEMSHEKAGLRDTLLRSTNLESTKLSYIVS